MDCLKIDNVLVSDPKLMANNLNIFFTSVAQKIVDEIHPTDRPPDIAISNDVPLLNFSDCPVTCTEIIETFDLLQPKKSQDLNGLSMFVLKKLSYQLAKPLCHIANLSLTNGVVPNEMKIAKIIPVFKSGDRTSMDNYRPISLLSCFSKVLEKIVSVRLSVFLENNNILSDSQFGFRTAHSTVHPMVKLLNTVSKALNKKHHTIAIFCDLRKAFDTCSHSILFSKMEKLGIRGPTLQWFKSYLSERKQFVSLDGILSDMLKISIGVPQGSILGPILFLLYINDLPECSTLLALLFADDTTLLASGDNIDDLITYVNEELRKIVTFFRMNKLSLHPAKTQFIIFTNSNAVRNKDVNLYINMNNLGEYNPDLIAPINRITCNSICPAVRFLGILFDPELNFKQHIKSISSKISKALYILRTVKNILSEKALKTLYYSLIHCHLVYGIHVWSSSSPSNLNGLVKMQKNAIRIITDSNYNAHTLPLFKKMVILPLESLIQFFRIQFMHKYVQGLLPAGFNNLWVNRDNMRGADFSVVLRNSDNLYIPTALLVQTERLPYFLFPRLWSEFTREDIKICRNSIQFNTLLKKHFLDLLPQVVTCNRLFCSSCSSV